MSKKPNILIVDDSQELSGVISEFLELNGYHIHTTTGSFEALKLIEAFDYDVVVSDIHMPDMDGLELMANIKEKHKGLPVVLITGYGVNEARKIAIEKGADAFVAKPFHMKELIDVISSLVKNRVNNIH